VRGLRVIGIAALGTEAPEGLAAKARRMVNALAEKCGGDFVLALGGYWGLMRVIVDEAIRRGIKVMLFPPIERESDYFPEEALVVKTGMGYRGRSVALVKTADILIAVGGEAGTIMEIVAAYLEGKPVFVLGGTGLSTDKMRVYEPHIDSRRFAELRFFESVEELASNVCSAVSTMKHRESF
jgi:uncharacterized protein (TIGR00725 family)